MFSSWKKNSKKRCGVVLDIGSGSVAAAVVVSSDGKEAPEIVWTYREPIATASEATEPTSKKLQGAILNVFLEMSVNGLKELRKKHPQTHPEVVQVAISAPFSHTIVKRINTNFPKPTKITSSIIKEMIGKADLEAEDIAAEKYLNDSQQLARIGGRTVAITLNGYLQKEFKPTTSKVATVCRSLGITSLSLRDTITQTANKVLPGIVVDIDTFMSLYKQAVTDLMPELRDAGFLDITGEASEFLLVRDGLPHSAPYIPHGRYTLERELISKLSISSTEAESILRDNDLDIDKLLSETRQESYKQIIENYTADLAKLFAETGNSFSLPSKIYLHTSKRYETFFTERIKEAAEQAGVQFTHIHPVTSELFEKIKAEDTAIFLSAYVFHRRLYDDEQTYMVK